MHSSLSWWSVFLTVSYSIKVEDKLKLVYIQGPSPEKNWSKLMSMKKNWRSVQVTGRDFWTQI